VRGGKQRRLQREEGVIEDVASQQVGGLEEDLEVILTVTKT
jgi:hypothetical protein